MKKLLTLLIVLAAMPFVLGATCPDVQSDNTKDFLAEIPSINTQLQQCPIQLPRGTSWLLGNPTNVNIQMNDGTTQSFSLTIQSGQITGISSTAGACAKSITTTEKVADSILSSSNRAGAAIFMIANKGITIKGCTTWKRFTNWFTNPVGRFVANKVAPSQMPPAQVWGKPDNCDETYLPGHRGYAENKQLWDSYSANADGVCQSQYGRGSPSPCVHSVQLSVSGNPYYLCWYRN